MPPRHPAERAERDRVVAAEDERQRAFARGASHFRGDPLARPPDFREEPRALAPGRNGLGESGGDVAEIRHLEAERLDPWAEIGVPDRGRAHVDAAPAGAEIERRADHRDRLRRFAGFHFGEATLVKPYAPIRVLVVDDDALVRAGLSMLLAGLEEIVIVGEAADGSGVAHAVAEHKPDIVLVGMGTPQQELWVEREFERIDARVVWTVGALFDYLSGRTPRAPHWLSDNGLEWIFRLAIEPRRMWRRYLLGNPAFLRRVWRERRERA